MKLKAQLFIIICVLFGSGPKKPTLKAEQIKSRNGKFLIFKSSDFVLGDSSFFVLVRLDANGS